MPGALLYGSDQEAREVSLCLFQKLDRNGDGHLTQDELLLARTVMLCKDEFGQRAVQSLTSLDAAMDTNGDSVIDMQEFHDFMTSLYEVMGRKHFLKMARAWAAAQPSPSPSPQAKVASARSRSVPRTPVAPGLRPSEAALQAAAAQVIHRRDSGRVSLPPTRRSSPQHPSSSSRASRKVADSIVSSGKMAAPESTEQKLTSLMECWEIYMRHGSERPKLTMEVGDFVRAFERCRRTGLDLRLVRYVPMHLKDLGEAEDLSPGEVAHLCTMIMEDPSLTIYEARAALDPIKETCREDAAAGEGNFAVIPGSTLSFKMFKNLLPIIASLMRIDIQYLVSHLQWVRTERFEMGDDLARVLIEKVIHKPSALGNQGPITPSNAQQTPDSLWDSLAAGNELMSPSHIQEAFSTKIGLDDFVRMCYNANIVDSTGRKGITYSDMMGHFQRTVQRLPELLRLHGERAYKPVASTPKSRADYIVGRTELEVLLEELLKEPRMQSEYGTPFNMVLCFIAASDEQSPRTEALRREQVAQYLIRETAAMREAARSRKGTSRTWK